MQRRAAIKKTLLIAGSIAIAPDLLANALAHPEPVWQQVPPERMAFLADLADTLIPDTDTPGARAAGAHTFMALMVEACFPGDKRDFFWQTLDDSGKRCIALYGSAFGECAAADRIAFLKLLEAESMAARQQAPETPTFFQVLKELALYGYFTAETGMTQALHYDPIPGVWIPDMPADENTKAWASMF